MDPRRKGHASGIPLITVSKRTEVQGIQYRDTVERSHLSVSQTLKLRVNCRGFYNRSKDIIISAQELSGHQGTLTQYKVRS